MKRCFISIPSSLLSGAFYSLLTLTSALLLLQLNQENCTVILYPCQTALPSCYLFAFDISNLYRQQL